MIAEHERAAGAKFIKRPDPVAKELRRLKAEKIKEWQSKNSQQ